MIYDNAEEETFDRAILPEPGAGATRILLTTRQRDFGGFARVVTLDCWPAERAARFLMERSGSDDEAGAAALAGALGGLALACEQAGAFCRQTGRTPAAYLALFETDPAGAMGLGGAAGHDDKRRTVAQTFALAIKQATADAPAAAAMLDVMA